MSHLWNLITNPPLEFVDPETDEVAESWKVGRVERWYITRSPRWTTAFTRRLDCGCSRRIRKTLICMAHAFPDEAAR